MMLMSVEILCNVLSSCCVDCCQTRNRSTGCSLAPAKQAQEVDWLRPLHGFIAPEQVRGQGSESEMQRLPVPAGREKNRAGSSIGTATDRQD